MGLAPADRGRHRPGGDRPPTAVPHRPRSPPARQQAPRRRRAGGNCGEGGERQPDRRPRARGQGIPGDGHDSAPRALPPDSSGRAGQGGVVRVPHPVQRPGRRGHRDRARPRRDPPRAGAHRGPADRAGVRVGPAVAGLCASLVTGPLGTGRLIGIGLDLVDIARFQRVLDRRPAMATRLFAPEELDYAGTLIRPGPTLAGRFAVKEAAMKALGVGLGAVDWTDVCALRQAGGAPRLVVRGRAARLAEDMGVVAWQVTISHTDLVASAAVVALS
ncbi:MAG: holo-ACP synthase [Acidimicrobiales bacterium]|nr:holo-ACP synthase [Acidimicrobiales bacterium]